MEGTQFHALLISIVRITDNLSNNKITLCETYLYFSQDKIHRHLTRATPHTKLFSSRVVSQHMCHIMVMYVVVTQSKKSYLQRLYAL